MISLRQVVSLFMLGYLLEPVQLYTCSATHVLAKRARQPHCTGQSYVHAPDVVDKEGIVHARECASWADTPPLRADQIDLPSSSFGAIGPQRVLIHRC